MKAHTRFFRSLRGFTLIELLIVIAVIGVMSALIVAAITNAAADTRLVLARQQQAVVQEAVNAWVAAQSATSSVQKVRQDYNDSTNRFFLVSGYLDATTLAHFQEYKGSATLPRSEAMAKSGKYLVFPDWTAGSYPQVNMEGP